MSICRVLNGKGELGVGTNEPKEHPIYSGLLIYPDGRAYCNWRKRFLKPHPRRQGYLQYSIKHQSKWILRPAHRLMLEAFYGVRGDEWEAAHNNGNPSDNRLENLRWATPKENSEDKIRHGRTKLGSEHHNSKLTEQDVWNIRLMLIDHKIREVAAAFGVALSTIKQIRSWDAWPHVRPYEPGEKLKHQKNCKFTAAIRRDRVKGASPDSEAAP